MNMFYFKRAADIVRGMCFAALLILCAAGIPLSLNIWPEMSDGMRVIWVLTLTVMSFALFVVMLVPVKWILEFWDNYKAKTQDSLKLDFVGLGLSILGVVLFGASVGLFGVFVILGIDLYLGFAGERERKLLSLMLILPCSLICLMAYAIFKDSLYALRNFHVIEKNKAKHSEIVRAKPICGDYE
jgi:hypothetical protein